MLGLRSRAAAIAATALILALVPPRLGLLNLIILTPAWVVTGVAGLLAYVVYSVDILHKVPTRSADRERHGLRPLAFTSPSAWSALLTRRSWEDTGSNTKLALHASSSSAFNTLSDTIMGLVKEHFILPWYQRISPSSAMPDQIELLVRRMLFELIKKAELVDWPTFMVARILPIVTEHLQHYRSVEHLASAQASSPTIPLPLPKKPHPALAPGAHTFTWGSASIDAHFRDRLEKLVKETLHNADRSVVVSTLVREVLLGTVWSPAFEMLCDSDFWNRQIDERAGQYLREQNQVNKFLSALSALPPPTASPRRSRDRAASVSAASSTRQFEAFLRSIPKVRTLGEARHLRSDIEREQRAAKIALDEAGIDKDEMRLKMAKKYVKRLERARLEIDNRITHLTGKSDAPASAHMDRTPTINLYSVMSDPSTLAYWLEFMERRQRSRMVQFWLTVEGFKNPLEENVSPTRLEASQTTKEDLTFLYEIYSGLSTTISDRHLEVIRQATEADSDHSLVVARQAMLAAQKEVYETMEEEDWPAFKRTELILKASAELSKASHTPSLPSVASPPSFTSSPLANSTPQLKAPRLKTIRQHGSFTPASTASAQVSTSIPNFERTMTEPRPSITRTMSDEHRSRSTTSSLPVTPPAPRRPSQLDFLISPDPDDRAKLFEDEEMEDADDDFVQVERMEAIQAALNEIIASNDLAGGRKSVERTPEPDPLATSLVLPRLKTDVSPKLSSKSAEDLRAAQLPPRADRNHLFDDIPDEIVEDLDDTPDAGYDSPRPAAPGNLQLSIEIARLQDKLTELVKQEHLVENLIRQAELIGNQHELRILQRSLSSVRREQRTTVFQKAQFEQQEEENRLVPGRTTVHIPTSVVTVDQKDHGKQVVRYSIEVKQVDESGTVVTGWMVARRYNEFWDLDKSLRDGLLPVPSEIPPKRLVTNMSSSFIDTRRVGLERYLQALLSSASVCESKPLQTFLSRDTVPLLEVTAPSLAPQNIVRSLYRTMATSLDEAILGPSMLDVMYTSLSRQLSDIGTLMGKSEDLGSMSSFLPVALKQGWSAPLPVQSLGGESGVGSFTAPICDLFIEVFDLKESNWLRRQAIVVILQQFLGGTIERRVRDSFTAATSAPSLERLLGTLQEILWPGGQRRPATAPRTDNEKSETRSNAGRKLGMLIPDVAANMIGRGNARRAARRVFGALQDQRLNQQLVLCVFDEILDVIFKRSA